MKVICCILFFCFFVCAANAGKSYTLTATRGDITIGNNSTDPALAPGDTLFVPATGKYTSVQYRHLKGDSLNKIWVIWLPGSEVKLSAAYTQLTNYNVSYVNIEGMRHFNFYGTDRFSFGVHDVVFKNCQWINPAGAFKDQPPVRWDDQYSPVSMVFTGKKSQTFYNITYSGCLFDGYKNTNIIEISSNWNSTNNEARRSIALDFEFVNDTFQNISIVNPANIQVIAGTGFGCKVHNCVFKNILGPAKTPASLSTSIFWFGSIDVSGCKQDNCYAHLLRSVPLGWSGLPGYYNKSTAARAWNNIIHNNLGYSAFEFIRDMRGERSDANGIHVVKAICAFNTIYRTKRSNGSGAYYGFLADNVNQDSLECVYNLIISPEYDYPFDPARGYVMSTIIAKPKYQVITGNKVFPSWNRSILSDTTNYKPGDAALLAGPAKNYPFINTDYTGKAVASKSRMYAGAVEGNKIKSRQ